MLRVLIIDDEKLVLDELENCIDWHALGFEIAGKAQNGLEGLAVLENKLPHIVITDIKMPVMDGLAFARRARERDPHLKIIFISGYDEFDFAKQAVKVEAFAYILKPVDTDELIEALNHAKARWEQEDALYQVSAASVEQYLCALLPEEKESKKNKIVNNLLQINDTFKETTYDLVYVSMDGFRAAHGESDTAVSSLEASVYEALSGVVRKICSGGFICNTSPGNFCCLINHTGGASYGTELLYKLAEQMMQCLRRINNISVTIAAGGGACGLEGLPAVYRSLAETAEERFYSGHGHIFMLEEQPLHTACKEIKVQNAAERLIASIRHGDMPQTETVLEDFFSKAEGAGLGEASFKLNVYSLFSTAFHEILPDADNPADFFSRENLQEGIQKFDTLSALRAFTSQIAAQASDALASDETGRHARIVEKAIDILRQSYARQLTIEELARQLYLSPSYLRVLFKKITGDTVYTMQTRIRLEQAEKMLADPDLKIKDIARGLGFDYTSHFIALFSKHKGMTPLEYRNVKALGWKPSGDRL